MSTARTYENWAYFLCNGGQKWPFFSFFYLLENWLKYIFFSCPPEKFYDIWAQLLFQVKIWKTFTKIKIYYAFVKLEGENFHNFITGRMNFRHPNRLWKVRKKFIIASAKKFWPWMPGRLHGREHLYVLYYEVWLWSVYTFIKQITSATVEPYMIHDP